MLEKVLFSEEQIAKRVGELAQELSDSYPPGSEVVLVGLLKGSLMLMADLSRKMTIPSTIDFMTLSSYSGTNTTGSVKVKKDLDMNPAGRHIVVVEDLVDTGTTLAWLLPYIKSKAPASLKLVTLLNKAERRKHEVKIDFCGFPCPDEFVVGYGMDFNEQFRTLPFVGVLKPSAYANPSPIEGPASL